MKSIEANAFDVLMGAETCGDVTVNPYQVSRKIVQIVPFFSLTHTTQSWVNITAIQNKSIPRIRPNRFGRLSCGHGQRMNHVSKLMNIWWICRDIDCWLLWGRKWKPCVSHYTLPHAAIYPYDESIIQSKIIFVFIDGKMNEIMKCE